MGRQLGLARFFAPPPAGSAPPKRVSRASEPDASELDEGGPFTGKNGVVPERAFASEGDLSEVVSQARSASGGGKASKRSSAEEVARAKPEKRARKDKVARRTEEREPVAAEEEGTKPGGGEGVEKAKRGENKDAKKKRKTTTKTKTKGLERGAEAEGRGVVDEGRSGARASATRSEHGSEPAAKAPVKASRRARVVESDSEASEAAASELPPEASSSLSASASSSIDVSVSSSVSSGAPVARRSRGRPRKSQSEGALAALREIEDANAGRSKPGSDALTSPASSPEPSLAAEEPAAGSDADAASPADGGGNALNGDAASPADGGGNASGAARASSALESSLSPLRLHALRVRSGAGSPVGGSAQPFDPESPVSPFAQAGFRERAALETLERLEGKRTRRSGRAEASCEDSGEGVKGPAAEASAAPSGAPSTDAAVAADASGGSSPEAVEKSLKMATKKKAATTKKKAATKKKKETAERAPVRDDGSGERSPVGVAASDAASPASSASSPSSSSSSSSAPSSPRSPRSPRSRSPTRGASGSVAEGVGVEAVRVAGALKAFDAPRAVSWPAGAPVPFGVLVEAFEAIASESKRLEIARILTNCFRTVLAGTPEDLLPALYLCTNRIAPASSGEELGVGDAALVKALAAATGRTEAGVKAAYALEGDLGAVAASSRGGQRTMFPPPPLTIRGVLADFRAVAKTAGTGSADRRRAIIVRLLAAAKGPEAGYVVRALQGRLRIGLAEQSVVLALAHAVALHQMERMQLVRMKWKGAPEGSGAEEALETDGSTTGAAKKSSPSPSSLPFAIPPLSSPDVFPPPLMDELLACDDAVQLLAHLGGKDALLETLEVLGKERKEYAALLNDLEAKCGTEEETDDGGVGALVAARSPEKGEAEARSKGAEAPAKEVGEVEGVATVKNVGEANEAGTRTAIGECKPEKMPARDLGERPPAERKAEASIPSSSPGSPSECKAEPVPASTLTASAPKAEPSAVLAEAPARPSSPSSSPSPSSPVPLPRAARAPAASAVSESVGEAKSAASAPASRDAFAVLMRSSRPPNTIKRCFAKAAGKPDEPTKTERGERTAKTAKNGTATERPTDGTATERSADGTATERSTTGKATERSTAEKATERSTAGKATERSTAEKATERSTAGKATERSTAGKATERSTAEKAPSTPSTDAPALFSAPPSSPPPPCALRSHAPPTSAVTSSGRGLLLGLSDGELAVRLGAAHAAVKLAYSRCPSFDVLVPALQTYPLWALNTVVGFSPGVPVRPMLARPATSISEVLERFRDKPFTCEYKYDGERAQIHVFVDDDEEEKKKKTKTREGAMKKEKKTLGGLVEATGTMAESSETMAETSETLKPKAENVKYVVRIFSRNGEDATERYPDVVGDLPLLLAPGTRSVVLDAEAVAFDREAKRLLPFQVLSTRGRKGVKLEDVQVRVCLFAFDCLEIDGVSMLDEPLTARRAALRRVVTPRPGELELAKERSSADVEELAAFLDEAVKAGTEGLIVKTLDGKYEPSKRSSSWFKLKKDYLDGVGDTFDVVPIGAWYGKGKRAGAFGSYLLAVYDEDREEYQTICKIGTGFSEEVLGELATKAETDVLPAPDPTYRHADALTPDVWLKPTQVWEVKAADLSLSPVHLAARGIVDPHKGISIRFPRLVRVREDKTPEESTSPAQVAAMFRAQAVHNLTTAPEGDEE